MRRSRSASAKAKETPIIPSKENLRLRVQLIAKFDRLAAQLADGDTTAIEEAHSHIAGLMVCQDCGTLSLAMKALAGMLTGMQEELDSEKYRW